MKKFLYTLLCWLGLAVSANMYAGEAPAEFTGPTWWDYRDESFSIEGKGTLLNPIVINTPEELAQFSYLVSKQRNLNINFDNKVVVLGADINLNKTVNGQRVQWVPIGYEYPFFGIFLGVNTSGMDQGDLSSLKRHTISGMYIHLGADDTANISKQKRYGLFYTTYGYLGYLNITDADISVDFSKNSASVWAGLLVAVSEGRERKIKESNAENSREIRVNTIIDAVSVAGKLNIVGNTNSTNGAGGIAAAYSNVHFGFFHCSSQVSINATNCRYAGSIAATCQIKEDSYFYYTSSITDCTSHSDITSVRNGMTETAYAGGILGNISEIYVPVSLVACSASGSIACSGSDFQVGGLIGNTWDNYIYGCTSMVNLSGNGELGGIVGRMNNQDKLFQVKCCSYSGHIDATQATYAGGLCGFMDYQDTQEHINGCLFTGTMTYTPGSTNYSVTVGGCSTPDNLVQNVSYCYYDKTLYGGNIAPGKAVLQSFQVTGLTTEDLISANEDKMLYLNIDNSAPYGFRLTKGYYPEVYNNYSSFDPSRDFYYYQSDNNENGLSEIAKKLFCIFNIYKENTVYRPGAWLSTIPVIIPKGDVAFDFVTHVITPSRKAEWNEQGRTIKVNSKFAYQNSPCIRVNNDTAFAVVNGSFMTTLTMKPDRPTDVWNRPLPFSASKQLCIVSTIDQVWDGSTATSFAAGTGKKEDPYLIKNGAQLAYAVKNNQEGKCFKQICDITLNENLILGLGGINYQKINWFDDIIWNAQYNGDNHYVKGALIKENSGLFGNISQTGEVQNLGIVDCGLRARSGAFAYQMNGRISNCIAEGLSIPFNINDEHYYLGHCGGISSLVGNTNPNAVIEDCVSAVSCYYFMFDYTPFVSLSDQNHGTVRNCIFVVPVGSDDATFSGSHSSAAGHDYIQNCYWLKGYEPLNTGCTLDEMGTAMSQRSLWTWNKGYFPMLKSFAKSDMGKLLSLPFRTDIDYTYNEYSQSSSNYLLGFSNQLTFEPGTAKWSVLVENYMEIDGDMGIIAPKYESFTPQAVHPEQYKVRTIIGSIFVESTFGKFKHFLIMRTSDVNVTKGITFVDENARQTCLDAFDANTDGFLSLSELKAITNEQTLTAFQTNRAKQIVHFPEFRFFKNVTELTTQLNGLSKLEDIQLPYALETISGGESDETSAFYGCNNLKTVTISSNVKNIEGHPFYGSAVENILVDPMNEDFVSHDGVLFDVNNVLVAYPNGRTGEEIVFPETIIEIAPEAVYKVDGLKRIYFETDDYKTVPYLNENGFVSSSDELMDIYVSDATHGSLLIQGYYDDGSWDEYINAGKLHCYYPLKIGSAKAATLYIGFDTELPSSLRPYIVPAVNEELHVVTLRQMEQKIPLHSPVIIFANEPGLYRLSPLDEKLNYWNMYENRLNGVGQDGMSITQGDSERGGILTLGRNSQGSLGFYYYTKEYLPPYRAYLTHDEIIDQNVHFFLSYENDDTDIVGIEKLADTSSQNGKNSHTLYDLQGRPVSETAAKPGIYIKDGHKVWIK